MSYETVEAIYKDGKVLFDKPLKIKRTRLFVTILDENSDDDTSIPRETDLHKQLSKFYDLDPSETRFKYE